MLRDEEYDDADTEYYDENEGTKYLLWLVKEKNIFLQWQLTQQKVILQKS